MGLQKGIGQLPDKHYGERRIVIRSHKHVQEREVSSPGIREQTEPFLLVCFPETKPFEKLVAGDIISFAEMFNGIKPCKVFAKDAEDKEEAKGGIGDDHIREDSVGMPTAVTEYPEDA